MQAMFNSIDWKSAKKNVSVVAAILLLFVSAIGFTTGLEFGGEWGFLASGAVWLAITIIQVVGNDSDNHVDWVFTIGWIFSYILGVGASTWAMYSWIEIPNEYLRWGVSFGLGGVVEILPEKMIVIFFQALKKARYLPTTPRQTAPQQSQTRQQAPNYTPLRPAASFGPQSRQQGKPQPPKASFQKPTTQYRNLSIDDDGDDPTYLKP